LAVPYKPTVPPAVVRLSALEIFKP
jgi:hypothetical protein